MTFPRRAFLQRSAVLGAATALPLVGYARRAAALERDPDLAPFFHGVASGDPLADRVVLWTRGALGRTSLTGRTRTAPAPGQDVDRLRFAVVSCANVQAGFFNAYARIAERDDLDAVIHLGDYLYEYPDIAVDPENGYGPGTGELSEPRPIEPATEMVTLHDYRLRHGTYKLDPDLVRLHQRHPMIATWDDHESTNNSHRDGAGNHQPDTEGDWQVRKRASARAYDE